MTDQTLCNFDCPYCVTQPIRRSVPKKMWGSEDGEDRFKRILRWLANTPWNLRIRLQTLGEPFVSSGFLSGAAWLSQQPNVQFVEMVTNGSFRDEQFHHFATTAEIRRITLWMTYHPTEITAEHLLSRAMLAKSLGAFVIVHCLIFPDTEEKIDFLINLCRKNDIPTDVTAGHNYNGAYGSAGLIPILNANPKALLRYRNKAVLKAMLTAHNDVLGLPCTAGHDYLFIRADGAVYPCGAYALLDHQQIGNVLNPEFKPVIQPGRYSPCTKSGVCSCKEDYLHLQIAKFTLKMGQSLGYCIGSLSQEESAKS